MSKLAIVIPAFKINYFGQVLESIANQTCKDFTCYVGNDASSDDIKSLIDKYTGKIDLVYKKFTDNLGGKNLVAQWERCIAMVGNEEWIWLFSDDDLMDLNCVENFYEALNQFPNYDLFHFNVFQIDEHQHIIDEYFPFPELLETEKFIEYRLQGILNSYVVEYIFAKSHFYSQGQFPNFDLGWGSDDALWVKLSKHKGIRTIPKANVYWRKSPFNISTNYRDQEILMRKCFSEIEFAKWMCNQAKKNEIRLPLKKLKLLSDQWLLQSIKAKIKMLSYPGIAVLVAQSYLVLEKQNNPNYRIVFLSGMKFYLDVKEKLKRVLFWNYFKKKVFSK